MSDATPARMDLRTHYVGLPLPHPLVLGSSPLVENVDAVRRAEEAGAAAIVMRSLFEEQVTIPRVARGGTELADRAFEEALHYLPRLPEFLLDPDQYVEHLARLKDVVSVPVIASLSGITQDGWVEYAARLERAGADALELNLYAIGSDPDESSEELEQRLLRVVSSVRAATTLPLSVKLSPFYTSLAHFAVSLRNRGADGLVLFNRFYQPDFDLEDLTVRPRLELSTSRELRLRLRWLAALSARMDINLTLSGGVHRPTDVVKGILAGAHCVQIVSEVLLHGVDVFRTLREGLARWMEEHGYETLASMRGLLNLAHCAHPAAHERANYMQVLNSWRPLPLDQARGVW